MDLVSVILTSYNRPEWLRNAIESVVNQTYQNWELFIMDDNSSNIEIKNVIYDFKTDSRINFYQSDASYEDRVATARYITLINKAYSWARGKYITYLTDDDDYFPSRLEKMVNFFQTTDAKIVYGWQYVYDEGFPDLGFVRAPQGPIAQAASLVDHCSVMHYKDLVSDINPWDDRAEFWGHGDAVFWQKLNDLGYLFYPIEEVLDRHRCSVGSVQSKMISGKMPYEE